MTELANIVNVPVPGSPRFEMDTAMAIARLRASLGPAGTPSFNTIALPGLTDNKPIYADADGVLTSVTVGTSLSFSAPTLNTIQGIRTTDTPTFAGLTLTAFSGVVKATAGVLAGGGAHADLATVTADQHHNQAHVLNSSDHTVSGLTTGHVLQALSATTFGFAVVPGLHDAVTLATSADILLGLTGQALSLDTQTATYVLAGPLTGSPVAPTFRALALTDLPTVTVGYGGTGQTSFAVGDIVHATAATTLAGLADVAAGAYLRSGGIATVPLWSTLILPNAATAYRLPVATSANTVGELATVGATGEYLAGSTGAIPVWAALNQAAVAGLTTASSPTFAGLTVNTNTIFVDVTNHRLGCGNLIPTAAVDILPHNYADFSVLSGGDVTAASRTDNTRKFTRWGMPHYDVDAQPVAILIGDSNSTYTELRFGGGTSVGNAVTRVVFYTGATTTTATGTVRASIESDGKVGIGVTPNELLEVNGKIRALTAFNLNGTDGVTQAASAGTVADPTAIAGGIVTAQTQITYIANGAHVLSGVISITTANGRITSFNLV